MATEIPRHDFVWQQGEDGEINLVYKSGSPAVPVDLTGYSVRMDVKSPTGTTPLFTFNSDEVADEPVAGEEAVLGPDGTIKITVGRQLSLSSGPLFSFVGQALNYDVFLRNPAGKQKKILKGTITYEASETLWT